MANKVCSDYLSVYDDCSQDVEVSALWSDPWPPSAASNGLGVVGIDLPPLFDAIEDDLTAEFGGVGPRPLLLSPLPSGTESNVDLLELPDELLSAEELSACDDDYRSISNTASPVAVEGGFTDLDSLKDSTCDGCRTSLVGCVVSDTCDEMEVECNGNSLVTEQYLLDCTLLDSSVGAGKMMNAVKYAASNEHYVVGSRNRDGDSDVIYRELVNSKPASRPADDIRSTSVRILPKRTAAKRLNTQGDSCTDDDSNDECSTVNRKSSRRKVCADDDVVTSSRRSACTELNRNALNAKLNREKKKAYIATLEAQQSKLRKENVKLNTMIADLTLERNKFANEVEYLRSVLANDSALAHLISGINGKNVYLSEKFETSRKRKHSSDGDHDYIPLAAKSSNSSSASAGVCLHVHQSHMSLEFCEQCARMSSKIRRDDSSS